MGCSPCAQPVYRYYSVYDIASPIRRFKAVDKAEPIYTLLFSTDEYNPLTLPIFSYLSKSTMRKMSYRLATIFSLLLTLLFSTPTLCIIPIANLTNSPTLSLPVLVSPPQGSQAPIQFQCFKRRTFSTNRQPTYTECHRAIRLLPDTHDSGIFHTTGFNNMWRLPRVESFGRCRAQVEIENRARAPSSWIAVKAALDLLARDCRKSFPLAREERTGGWMLAGPEGRIKVSLLGPDDPASPSLEGNLTSTE